MRPIIEQAEGRMIDLAELAPAARSYNAGMTDFRGRRLMVYRHEPPDDWRCKIRLAEFEADAVKADTLVAVPVTRTNENLEDPRIFHHAGGLWLAWTAAYYESRKWTCRQYYGRLVEGPDGWIVAEHFAPRFGRNDGTRKEKNWQFFEADGGRLFAQYGQSPHHVIELKGERVIREFKSPGLLWAWGKPSGGTPPIPYAPGQLITFFHAYEFDSQFQRRYNFAALVFEDKPPFKQVAQSVAPLVIASELDPLPGSDGWIPLCIFPCGAVETPSGWDVSSGVNDCRIAIQHFPHGSLQLALIAQFNRKAPFMKIRILKPIYCDGQIQLAGTVVEVETRAATDHVRRGRAMPVAGVAEPEGEPVKNPPRRTRKRA